MQPTTQLFYGLTGCPSCCPTNSIKAVTELCVVPPTARSSAHHTATRSMFPVSMDILETKMFSVGDKKYLSANATVSHYQTATSAKFMLTLLQFT